MYEYTEQFNYIITDSHIFFLFVFLYSSWFQAASSMISWLRTLNRTRRTNTFDFSDFAFFFFSPQFLMSRHFLFLTRSIMPYRHFIFPNGKREKKACTTFSSSTVSSNEASELLFSQSRLSVVHIQSQIEFKWCVWNFLFSGYAILSILLLSFIQAGYKAATGYEARNGEVAARSLAPLNMKPMSSTIKKAISNLAFV